MASVQSAKNGSLSERINENYEFERDPKAPLYINIDHVDVTQTEDLFRKGTLIYYVQVKEITISTGEKEYFNDRYIQNLSFSTRIAK